VRRAKIVCTLGPAVSDEGSVRGLVEAGMDVARLNMSHGSHADHERAYRMVRAAAAETGRGVRVFADLQGPKIRLARFADGPGLPGDVNVGDPILIDDGKVRLRVTEFTDDTVHTVVEVAGKVSNNKGINLPGVAVSVPAMSEKDVDDLKFALSLGVDYVALSF